jgi:hypothetical protein
MAELAAITPERHAGKVWKHGTDYAFAAEDNVISLVGAELTKVVLGMPTGFVKLDAGYQLVAITSLQPGLNLYVAPDGKWLGEYIPAALRAYPFKLAQHESAGEFILCINEASGLVAESEDDGNAFFDNQDQPTQKTMEILNFLLEVKASLAVTQEAVNALADAGLITPWEINLKQGEQVVPVKGLFGIDEAALNRLEDKNFLTLRKSGALAIAYAQLMSTNRIARLESLDQLHTEIVAQTVKSAPGSLEGFSLAEDEGSLIFE